MIEIHLDRAVKEVNLMKYLREYAMHQDSHRSCLTLPATEDLLFSTTFDIFLVLFLFKTGKKALL